MKATLKSLQLELWLRRRNSGELRWTTKDGREIPIKDMTDKHIENAISTLLRLDDMIEIEVDYDRMGD